MAARTPKQQAALKKAQAASAAKRRLKSAVTQYNQNGPVGKAKKIGEGLSAKYPVSSRAASGVKRPKLKPKGIGATIIGNPEMGDYGWRN